MSKYLLMIYLDEGADGAVEAEFDAESDDSARAIAIKKRDKELNRYGRASGKEAQAKLFKQIPYP